MSSPCIFIEGGRTLRKSIWHLAGTIGVAWAVLAASGAKADLLERLVMPGELAQSHMKLEQDCGSCHASFDKKAQTGLCLACHKNVAADIGQRQGFHGRHDTTRTAECRTCHTDHQGRTAKIAPLESETFDHGNTDFPLLGAHQEAACRSCHAPERKFRDAPAACVECHRQNDRHQGRLGPRCADCHDPAAWSRARFDHDRTGFALGGAHARVFCESCHPDNRFADTAKTCNGCHAADDTHGGRYGERCESCHVTAAWRSLVFDHGRDTGFGLDGRHATARCEACHTRPLGNKPPPATCNACHAKDDKHQGRNGARCSACHTASNWKTVTFNHDRDTSFPLAGGHAKIACADCHADPAFKDRPGKTCAACHAPDDAHGGRLGRDCERCHNETGWAAEIFFDHDLGRFPLVGLHVAVPCEECHRDQAFRDTATDCAACHADADTHRGRLGSNCALCHNPNGWSFWQFDHDRQTHFRLDGAHEGLGCLACHTEPAGKPGTTCAACHRRDDVHRGSFGARCERCHVTESFRDLRLVQ